jgi:hypothetical protein
VVDIRIDLSDGVAKNIVETVISLRASALACGECQRS